VFTREAFILFSYQGFFLVELQSVRKIISENKNTYSSNLIIPFKWLSLLRIIFKNTIYLLISYSGELLVIVSFPEILK